MTDERDVVMLVDRARTGHSDAWEALYRRAYPRLFAYARRRLFAEQAADDAVSETMARAIKGIAGFEWRGGGFDAWIYGILRNVLLEGARHAARHVSANVPEPACPEPGPLGRVLADEEAAELRSAFALLSPEDQEVLELRVVGGLAAEEVAGVIGKSPGAVRMAQSRALSRLRGLLVEGAPA